MLFVSECAHQTLLLVANSIDSNADCTRLVVDGWLELELRDPEAALKTLSTALTHRAEWERLLLAQLGTSTMGGQAVQGVSRKVTEKLSEGLVRYLLYTEVLTQYWPAAGYICYKFLLSRRSQWLRYVFIFLLPHQSTLSLLLCTSYLPSQVSYSLRRLTAFQTQNLYIGPRSESELPHTNAPGLSALFPGAEAKPDPIKGGLRVTSFFNYNCLAVSLSV